MFSVFLLLDFFASYDCRSLLLEIPSSFDTVVTTLLLINMVTMVIMITIFSCLRFSLTVPHSASTVAIPEKDEYLKFSSFYPPESLAATSISKTHPIS